MGDNESTPTPPYSSTLLPKIQEVDLLYFAVILTCFLVGSTGNILALKYFLSKTKDIPTSIYICISVVDITVSVLVLPLGLPYVLHNRDGWLLKNSPGFCNTWGTLWYILSTLSIFLVAVMSITRTIHIVCPFRTLSKRAVMGVIAGYVILLSVQSTIPLWVGEKYFYDLSFTVTCTWRNDILNGPAYHVYTQMFFFETYFPILPILISCVMTIRSLKSSENSALNRANRSVTVTIVLFTVIYMLCSLPPVVMYLLTIITQNFNLGLDLWWWDRPFWYFFKFYHVLLIPINSALNPVLYMCRMEKMRVWTRERLEEYVRITPPAGKFGDSVERSSKVTPV